MDPITLAFAALSVGNTLLKGYSYAKQNEMQAAQYRRQAAELLISGKENYAFAMQEISLLQRTAAENSRQVEYAGQQLLMQEEIAGKKRIGSIRARAGASGASVNVGTPANVQISQEFQNQFNQRTIDYNMRYEQARIRLEANNASRMKQRSAEIAYNQAVRKAKILKSSATDLAGSRDMGLLNILLGGVTQGVQGADQLGAFD